METDLNTLADTYLRHHDTNRDEDFWAWEEVSEIVRSRDVDRAWEITFLLLKKATSDDELACIAAGPLEDLVDGYGDNALDRLERACDEDSRLQFALSGIWLLPDSPVLQRWQELMIKYGFASGKRKPLSRHPDCWPDTWAET
jgi:hypothetical protein